MKVSNYLLVIVLLTGATFCVLAQRPRTVEKDQASEAAADEEMAPPPDIIRAQYQGGILGYSKKEDGTLGLDDKNSRLVFRNKLNKEIISIPFNALTAAYGDTKSLSPMAATVASNIPSIYALPARFIKKKYQYLTLQFNDPDNDISGITSFKLENKEVLASELVALAKKSGLTQRGEGFVRKKGVDPQTAAATAASNDDTISGGLLNDKATALPRPDYPDAAKQAHAAGTVSVQVTVDEQGGVIDAKAVSGDPTLQDAAVAAARKAKFPPTTYKGRPVKVIGVINYSFVL